MKQASDTSAFTFESRARLERSVMGRAIAFVLFAMLATSCALPAATQSRPATGFDILDKNSGAEAIELPDYSYAGYGFGLGEIPDGEGWARIDVTEFGVVPDDGLDDTKALKAALKAAHETDGPVIVELPVGQIILSEILKVERSDFILRGKGAGESGTEIFISRPLAMVETPDSLNELREYLVRYDKRQKEPANNINLLFSEYSWSGGFIWVQKPGTRAAPYLEERDEAPLKLADAVSGKRFSNRVRVSSTDGLAVGDVIQVQWFNTAGPDSPLIDAIYGATELEIGSHHWTFPGRPLVVQPTRILAIDGDWITIGDPLLHDIGADIPAQISAWDHLTEIGFEDFRIAFPDAVSFGHHLERGYNGIYLTSVFNGWIRDITIVNADSGILTYNSASVTISRVTTLGERRAHYAVHLGNVHNFLVSDITIFNPVIHSLTFNTQSTRSVYLRATVYLESVLDQHAGANHQNLFDSVTLYIIAKRGEDGPYYPLWDGSGAGYWQPGHGRFSTSWNLNIQVLGGADRTETVELQGLAEGPGARVVGVSGNRNFRIRYLPAPYLEAINGDMRAVPSLYEWQLEQRRKATKK